MAKLEIRVGAAVDRNLGVAFRPLVEGAKRAAAAVEAEQRKTAKAIAREAQKAANDEARAYQKAAKEIARWQVEAKRNAEKQKREEVRTFESAEREKTKLAEREARARARAESASAREQQRLALAYARDTERHMARAASEQRAKDRTAWGTTKAVGAAAGRAALGIAGSIARGAGVTTDVGSMFGKNADLETMATQLSAAAFMPGDTGRNGMRVDPRELMAQALSVGAATGTDANEVMAGLQKFVGLTGDLATGRDVMQDMLKLSKATGTEFSDMAAAAGNVAANLPDTADKAERIRDVMQAIAGQGKLGAVEIKDLAGAMAKLAANAGMFSGDKGANIRELGILAQEARARGTASTAQIATTSVQSFVATFDKGSREKAFEKFGVQTRDKSGALRAPEMIIKDALKAAASDQFGGRARFSANMAQMFADVQARRSTKGFEAIYRESGFDMDKVSEEFERLRRATMSNAEVQESFRRAMATGPSQAEQFNQEMRKAALEMQTALYPALIALSPAVIDVAQQIAKVTDDLLGPDKGARALATNTDKARAVLDSAATQVAGGNISEATRAEMTAQERDLKAAMELAQRDAGAASSSKPGWLGRTAAMAFDFSALGNIVELIGGGSMGHGLGEAYLKNQDVDAQKKQWQADDAKRLYEEMANANKILQQRIDGGLKVIVMNPEAMKDAPGPPGLSGGRTPSPEERAGQ